MQLRYKEILFAFFLIVTTLIVVYAAHVFLLAFATILWAILLNAIGKGTQKVTHLPYLLALLTGLVCIVAVLSLIFWLYSPLIVEQFELLMNQLPEATEDLRSVVTPYLQQNSLTQDLSFTNQKILAHVMTAFSSTIGSIVSFVIFLVVGFYLAMAPQNYVKGLKFLIPDKKVDQVWEIFLKIGRTIRWWLLGKVLSMIAIGIMTLIGLWILDVSLAFILALLAALLTFIPYVGPILAAIPAILIAFSQSPLTALYVIVLYLAIHVAEGYFITPFIEQKTVSIPPALAIMGQVLLFFLVGGLGLALASPLIVVLMALAQSLKTLRNPKRYAAS